jgi:hypothetical protein
MADGHSNQEMTEKLAKFENMYDALRLEKNKILEEMERMRLAGKTKTVTYQQLIANKLMVMNLLGRFEIYGL